LLRLEGCKALRKRGDHRLALRLSLVWLSGKRLRLPRCLQCNVPVLAHHLVEGISERLNHRLAILDGLP
jgi:hypothetical protein